MREFSCLTLTKEYIFSGIASEGKLGSFKEKVNYSLLEDILDVSYDNYVQAIMLILRNIQEYAKVTGNDIRIGECCMAF